MNYYIDTEFLEGTQKKRFLGMPYGNTPPTIDLISIGIVAEDGREYYAISSEFNVEEAWHRYDIKTTVHYPQMSETEEKVYWIRDNVLLPIYMECIRGDAKNIFPFTLKTMKWVVSAYGKTRKEIAKEIINLTSHNGIKYTPDMPYAGINKPSFYGYYSDYDWVSFFWLFGKMVDLPKGFPMFCIDLKQELDAALTGDMIRIGQRIHANELVELRAIPDKETRLSWIKKYSKCYPSQQNEHNALADARWNKQLHDFIKQL